MKLIKQSILGLFILGGLFAVSCSQDKDIVDPGENNKISIELSSMVDVHTKSLRSTQQDTQIAKDEEVGLFVTKTTSPTDIHYNNVKIVADGNGKFSYATTMYHPVNNDNVDFFAYHPYVAGVLLNNALDFQIKADQTVLSNFLNSDLLWSNKANVAKSKNIVDLKFVHKLSKINFTIKEGVGMDLSGLASVEVVNINPGASLNLLDGALTEATGTPVEVKAYGVTGTGAEETQVNGISAIIVPQTVSSGNKLFKIVVNGGTADEVAYYYTPDVDVTFDGGKKYNYILTINHAGIEVSSTIEDWIDGGTTEGEGSLE